MNWSKPVVGLIGASLALVPCAAVVASAAVPAVPAVSAVSAPVVRAMTPCYRDVENGGLGMTQSGGVSTYAAAANRQWARSENIWGTASGCVNLVRGRRISYSFDIKPATGATRPSVWHTVSQLQGWTIRHTWPGPPVALVVESGQWRVEGGYLVPNGSGGLRRDLGYTKYLAKVKPGVWQHWAFDVLLGGPRVGTVAAWLDGRLVVPTFKPPAGTMYAVSNSYSTLYLQLKTGLYTGAGSAADAPAWRRSVQVKNVRYSLR